MVGLMSFIICYNILNGEEVYRPIMLLKRIFFFLKKSRANVEKEEAMENRKRMCVCVCFASCLSLNYFGIPLIINVKLNKSTRANIENLGIGRVREQ